MLLVDVLILTWVIILTQLQWNVLTLLVQELIFIWVICHLTCIVEIWRTLVHHHQLIMVHSWTNALRAVHSRGVIVLMLELIHIVVEWPI